MLARPHRWLIGLFAAAACFTAPALAGVGLWGNDGHKIVAQIAYDNLKPAAKAKVDDLLNGDTLATFAVWPDQVKHTPTYSWTGPWHFADMPEDADAFVMERDCPEAGCVVQGILDNAATLAGADTTRDQRAEALKFLAHYVGDVHQPLHIGHKSDKGGNDIQVRLYAASKNLHSVWDDGLIKHRGKDWVAYATLLEQQIDAAKAQQWVAVTDPAQWATESHQLAEDHAYRQPNGTLVQAGDALGDDYYNEAIPIVEEQLTKAGLRLASILNGIYEAPTTPTGGTPPPPPPGTSPGVVYVGSRKSQVYHYPGCTDVENILPENLVEYTAAPPGKHLHHGCPR